MLSETRETLGLEWARMQPRHPVPPLVLGLKPSKLNFSQPPVPRKERMGLPALVIAVPGAAAS